MALLQNLYFVKFGFIYPLQLRKFLSTYSVPIIMLNSGYIKITKPPMLPSRRVECSHLPCPDVQVVRMSCCFLGTSLS